MTLPRSQLISLETTKWYHCVSRCVRRSFLCGQDPNTGKDYSHRKSWIASRIKELAQVFCVEIAAYAVMSNHYHIVLYINKEEALALKEQEVLSRWFSIFKRPFVAKRYLDSQGEGMDQREIERVKEMIPELRRRLYDISWFMRCLNEHIARLANKEDKVRGRFWDGRYKSQALLDEKALLAAMSYVDLNPIRAGQARSIEECEYTSIKERLENESADQVQQASKDKASLMPFGEDPQPSTPSIPFKFEEYIQLVEWTGRYIRKEGRGYIKDNVPPILYRLRVEPKSFLTFAKTFLKKFGHAIGSKSSLKGLCNRRGIERTKGLVAAQKLFNLKAA